MKFLRIGLVLLALIALGMVGVWQYMERIANPRIAQEILDDPDGERAQKVMLLTLPSGRQIPVNYFREDGLVFAGADGSWWEELEGEGFPVTVVVRGETLSGRGRAVLDDPDYTERVFAKLRPDAVPGFGTLIEIQLDAPAASPGAP